MNGGCVVVERGTVSRARARLLSDGKRLHLQDGPIDLIIEADGSEEPVKVAYRVAMHRFTAVLDELCEELSELRRPAVATHCALRGPIARRMYDAVAPFAQEHFITPMAAVAGAVAEEILSVMQREANLKRAYVNNGGDIAYHLTPDHWYAVGLVDQPERAVPFCRVAIRHNSAIRGIATSGRHGRSFSLGIADAVTVFAASASKADAAATIIANSVDLPQRHGIMRVPAREIDLNSDLGDRLVVRGVPHLELSEVEAALDAGCLVAEQSMCSGLIEGAVLRLQNTTRICGAAGRSFLIQGAMAPNEHTKREMVRWRTITKRVS
ncbi:ApbE superfamily uncharacterized protein (UPF0280 family) [Nitrobacteraceae bacterium AZCC 1564]